MGSKQGDDSQKRSMPPKPNVPSKPGIKPGPGDGRPGGDMGSRIPPGPEDRSRKPGRGIPSRYLTFC